MFQRDTTSSTSAAAVGERVPDDEQHGVREEEDEHRLAEPPMQRHRGILPDGPLDERHARGEHEHHEHEVGRDEARHDPGRGQRRRRGR